MPSNDRISCEHCHSNCVCPYPNTCSCLRGRGALDELTRVELYACSICIYIKSDQITSRNNIPYHTIHCHSIPYHSVPYRAVPHNNMPSHTSANAGANTGMDSDADTNTKIGPTSHDTNTLHYNNIRSNQSTCNRVLFNTPQHKNNNAQHNSIRYDATHFNSIQYQANTINTRHCATPQYSNTQ